MKAHLQPCSISSLLIGQTGSREMDVYNPWYRGPQVGRSHHWNVSRTAEDSCMDQGKSKTITAFVMTPTNGFLPPTLDMNPCSRVVELQLNAFCFNHFQILSNRFEVLAAAGGMLCLCTMCYGPTCHRTLSLFPNLLPWFCSVHT